MTTLAELATTRPAASRVFHRYHLDFCCGGNRPFDEVCREEGLDPSALMQEIEDETPREDDVVWHERPLPELIDHIITRYHETLRAELPRLLEMAQKIEAVHQEKASCPKGLAEHLAHIADDVYAHLGKEEQILFPMIASQSGVRPYQPITVMLREHDDHAANLVKTRRLATDFTAPPEACATWRALYLGLETLERELMDHIHLENNVLFPRALNGHRGSPEER